MEKWLRVMIIVVLVLSLSSCTSTENKEPAEDVELIDSQDVKNHAQQFIELMVNENFVAASKDFDSKMNEGFPISTFEETWNNLIEQVGNYQSQENIEIDSTNKDYDTVIVTAKFDKAILDINVVYNKNREIAGLFFMPHIDQDNEDKQISSAYKETEVTIGSDEWALPGTLTLPTGNGPFPLVILVHGSGPNDRDETLGPNKPFRDIAHGLAEKGIAVYRYDKRTLIHGEKIAANIESFTVKEETIDDAIIAVNTLSQNDQIDKGRIYVLGHSLGGTLIPRIAAADDSIAGFIMLAGASKPIEELMLEQYQYIFSADGAISESEQDQIDAIQVELDKIKNLKSNPNINPKEIILGAAPKYWLDLAEYDPVQSAKSIVSPLLILQGERDYQVNMDNFEIWKNELENKSNVSYKTYPKLNHLFFEGEGKILPSEYQNQSLVPSYVINDIATWVFSEKN